MPLSSFQVAIVPVVLVLGFVVMFFAIAIAAGKRRRRAFGDAFSQMNLVGSADPDKLQKDAAFNRFPALHRIMKHGSRGVQWFADQPGAAPPVFLIEHSYVVSTGKSSHSVYHTAAVVAVPATWSEVSITRETVFTKIGKLFGLKDLDLEDPEFNKTWRVRTSNENFALALLTPEVQRVLADTDSGFRGESWIVGAGAMALIIGSQIKPEELPRLQTRLSKFLAALAPELRSQIGAG